MDNEFFVEDKLYDILKIHRDIEKLQEQERKTWDEIESFEAQRMRGPFWRLRAWTKRGDSFALRFLPMAYILFLALDGVDEARKIFTRDGVIFGAIETLIFFVLLIPFTYGIYAAPERSQAKGRNNGKLLLMEIAALGVLTLFLWRNHLL